MIQKKQPIRMVKKKRKANNHEKANCLRTSLPPGDAKPTTKVINKQGTPTLKRASNILLTFRISKISGLGTVKCSCLIVPIGFVWSQFWPVAPEQWALG